MGYGSWGMDRFAKWGMDRGMDHGVWIVCGPGTLIHALYFYPHPYIYVLIYTYLDTYPMDPNTF